jgi:hypothetical protein
MIKMHTGQESRRLGDWDSRESEYEIERASRRSLFPLACHLDVRETLRCEPKIGDLRTAGFVLSINKGSVVYEERGISP